jgi:hypothetical protein
VPPFHYADNGPSVPPKIQLPDRGSGTYRCCGEARRLCLQMLRAGRIIAACHDFFSLRLLCVLSVTAVSFCLSFRSEVLPVLDSRLSLGQAHSPRVRGHLWPSGAGLASPRRRADRGPRHGRMSAGGALASRSGRRRAVAHSGAVLHVPTANAGPRRGEIPGSSRESCTSPMAAGTRLNSEAQGARAALAERPN